MGDYMIGNPQMGPGSDRQRLDHGWFPECAGHPGDGQPFNPDYAPIAAVWTPTHCAGPVTVTYDPVCDPSSSMSARMAQWFKPMRCAEPAKPPAAAEDVDVLAEPTEDYNWHEAPSGPHSKGRERCCGTGPRGH